VSTSVSNDGVGRRRFGRAGAAVLACCAAV